MDIPPHSEAEEAARLRRCLNDLVSIVALPALWSGGEPPRIIDTLLDALVGMLDAAFVFARLNDAEDGPPIEVRRVAESWEAGLGTREIERALDASLGDGSRNWPPVTRVVIGGAPLSVASARLGLQGEIGTVIVGCERSDFPGETERLILDVAVNQAAIGLQQARLLSEQRRVAAELDEHVAQRTRELAAANDELKKEIAERRRTEQALRANELNFQLTVDSIPGMVHTMSATGGVEFVNHQILDYFGRTLEELNDWGLVHPDDRARIIDLWTHSVATGEPYDAEHRVLRADGTYGWLHSRGLPLRDISGSIVRWYNLLTDIDERKRAEEALRESERESRLIVDTIPGLVAMLTPAGEVDFVNHPARRILRPAARGDEAMGHERHGAFRGSASRQSRSLHSRSHQASHTTSRRASGVSIGVYRWFQLRGLPLRDSSEHIARWYVLLTDIDDRKRAEDSIRASERSLN